ncbi:MAG: phosphatase PAP2 family protein [candidate division NC10 bacterium]|nr:phosphatase PAP2 family protein [candidate division NC10 bacterium]
MPDLVAWLDTADLWWFLLINRGGQNGILDLVMPLLSEKRYALIPGTALILLIGWRGGRRAWAWLAAAGLALALCDGLANILKHVFQRIRPCHVVAGVHLLSGCTQSFALPSNHAGNMAALATVAWLGSPRRGWLVACIAGLVGYSRIYLGVHYPADVMAGFVLGACGAWLVVQGAGRLLPQYFGSPTNPPRLGALPTSTSDPPPSAGPPA